MIAPPAAKNTPVKAAPGAARERLLDAAAVVFAREGIAGSTTREIAQAAGVNEVTLFRLFQNKQNDLGGFISCCKWVLTLMAIVYATGLLTLVNQDPDIAALQVFSVPDSKM